MEVPKAFCSYFTEPEPATAAMVLGGYSEFGGYTDSVELWGCDEGQMEVVSWLNMN